MSGLINAIELMAFFGAAALVYFLLAKLSKLVQMSRRSESLFALILLGAVIGVFFLLFKSEGYIAPDWSERARR
jgi:hypothetical protein